METWKKLQSQVTRISNIHLWFLQWDSGLCICVYIYMRQGSSDQNRSLFFSATSNICIDQAWMRSSVPVGVALTRKTCQDFFFSKDTPVKCLTGSFLCGDFPVFLWYFWLEFSVCKRCYLTALCSWKPLVIDRSCTLKAEEISLCQPGEGHPAAWRN